MSFVTKQKRLMINELTHFETCSSNYANNLLLVCGGQHLGIQAYLDGTNISGNTILNRIHNTGHTFLV